MPKEMTTGTTILKTTRTRTTTRTTRTAPTKTPTTKPASRAEAARGGALTGLLAGSSLLRSLPEGPRRALVSHLEPLDLEAGDFVFLQSDPGDALYLVERGRLRVFRTSADGRERTLAHLAPGDILGEMALLDGLPRSATVQAVEPCRLWRLPRHAFLEALRADPGLATGLIQLLAQRLREADRHLEEAAAGPVPERLLRVLRQLALERPGPPAAGAPQRLRVTQDELASMVGTTRESINRALRRLEARGVVVGRGRGYLLLDRRRLLDLFSGPSRSLPLRERP